MQQLIGHDAILRELRGLALGDDPPHALLFAGPEGTGRVLLAREYARLLNCERAAPPPAGAAFAGFEPPPVDPEELPCGECRSCRLIAEGSHPDVIVMSPGDTLCRPRGGESSHAKHPDSRDIRICQVRGAIELAARYPFEARYRLVIIEPADRLAREASHAILKTLEEPPPHTFFALVTAAPEVLLETIISRCRRIDVRPVPRSEVEEGLLARGIESGLAARAAAAARGRPGRAIAFAENPDDMARRERMLEKCTRVAGEGLKGRFDYAEGLADRYRSQRASVLEELDAWEALWEQELLAAARDGSADTARLAGTLDALRAVAACREHLLANVIARAAIELMLLSFPRRTLEAAPEDVTAAHA
ncbi:MAG: hypothetical protein IT303_03000 [Dehalococcoidia bacterium]|nr:hypothetical protein [Dehalococcoidia bacterium]